MFHEAVLFRIWIMGVLEKDLEQARKDLVTAGDRREWDDATEAEAKLQYINDLLKKARDFHIVT